jgi:AcrR family transcriptional regulator
MSAQQPQSQPEPLALPPGLDLLWGRRERGKRGPRPGLSADAIVGAAIGVADAEGLEAVSMARVAKELGFTTMSLYRHVASKEELLQLMWNASATGAETLVLEGDGWRARLRMWATVQRDMLDVHPWITQMPMTGPPLGPNSMHFIERGLEALDGTGLTDDEKLRFIGLISSYTLSEARMANDAARAAKQAMEAGQPLDPTHFASYEVVLRELVDEKTFPRVYRMAWSAADSGAPDERAEFLWGLERILDSVQALIDQTVRGDLPWTASAHPRAGGRAGGRRRPCGGRPRRRAVARSWRSPTSSTPGPRRARPRQGRGPGPRSPPAAAPGWTRPPG